MLEEVAIVELMDATDPGEHNGDAVADPEAAGLVSRTIPLDDSTSQANVSITSVTVVGRGKLKINVWDKSVWDKKAKDLILRYYSR